MSIKKEVTKEKLREEKLLEGLPEKIKYKIKYKMKPNDWRYITIKNSHAMIEDFIEKTKYTYEDLNSNKWQEIKWEMQHSGISFQQLKDELLDQTIKELQVHHGSDEYEEYSPEPKPPKSPKFPKGGFALNAKDK